MFASNSRYEKYRTGRAITFTFFALLVAAFLTGVCAMLLGTASFGAGMLLSYFTHPLILLLNVLVPMLLSAILYLLFNRALAAYIPTALLTLIPAVVNHYKLSLRGDPLLFADLSLALESAKMLETYELFMDASLWITLAVFAVSVTLLAIFAKGRFRSPLPRLIAALCLLLASILLVPVYTDVDVYDAHTQNNDRINEWSDGQKYISKGFIYPFIYSTKFAFSSAPEGYKASEAREALAAYTDEVIEDGKKINIVSVMLEAYTDLSRIDSLEFYSDEVYEKYHMLESIGVSGTLITDIFAGDTRISERQFLTGLPYARLDDFVSKSNSYVWYLRENGYTVEGAHPSYGWFYNRENINENLGFENYFFSENYFKPITNVDITYDTTFFPLLRDIYLERDKSRPYFSYSLTYQGHGPYETDVSNYPYPYVKAPEGVSLENERIMNNYLQSIKVTTEQVYKFVTELYWTEEPLVLVFYGDHKPYFGANGEVYSAYGINMDTSTEDGFENYYGTRYLIIANDAAKRISGNSFTGEGETISASFLMNKVFELCGYKGNAYMQFTSDIMKKQPVIHRSNDFAEGDARLYDCVSYYYRKNFIY